MPAHQLDRLIVVHVRDRLGRLLPEAAIEFDVNGSHAGEIPNSDGHGTLQVSSRGAVVTVRARYRGQVQSVTLAQGQDNHTFTFKVTIPTPFVVGILMLGALLSLSVLLEGPMANHIPLAFGITLMLIAIVLAFAFGEVNALQRRLILAMSSLGGGAVATEIPGFLRVNVSLGTSLVIGAAGALAVFILLYFYGPGADE